MWDGFNHRRFPRLSLSCEIAIQPKLSSKTITTKTENVGLGGVCVLQPEVLERFSKCLVKLELGKGGPTIQSPGKISWIIERKIPKKKKSVFDTGIEFTNMAPEYQRQLKEYIESHCKSGFQKIEVD